MAEPARDPALDAMVRQAINQWRDSLVNLTARNRLLNFKPSRTGSVEIVAPGVTALLQAVESGEPLRFASASEAAPATQDELPAVLSGVADEESASVLQTAKAAPDLSAALRSMLRRSRQEYLDRGLSVLYLALGTLHWKEIDGATYCSPLLLIPVELLPRGKQPPDLVRREAEATVNPTLTLKLAMMDLTLPSLADPDEPDYPLLRHRVEECIGDLSEWRVEDAATLSYFSFAKEAMYKDLVENEDAVAASQIVQALVHGPGGGGSFMFDALPDQRVDTDAAPETTPLVLDADSSQRAAVAAAAQGQSFVMDGPPGTGKSQTIANMIGTLLHEGRTVLFVSEKAAALEVVKNRLTSAGLGSYLLELHSHKATRKEVAAQLGQALETRPVPPQALGAVEKATVRERREALSAFAEAVNAVRYPLGLSLHDVVGRIANLHEVPAAPVADFAPDTLTVRRLQEVLEQAHKLARSWRPALQRDTFAWREVVRPEGAEAKLYQASVSLRDLHGYVKVNRGVAAAFGLAELSRCDRLIALIDGWADRGVTPASWLTAVDLTAITDVVTRAIADVRAVNEIDRVAAERSQVPWHALPDVDPVGINTDGTDRAPSTDVAPLALDTMTTKQLRDLVHEFDQQIQRLGGIERTLMSLAAQLRRPAPTTFDDAWILLEVAALGISARRPATSWLSPAGHAAAIAAVASLQAVTDDVRHRRDAALAVFEQRAFALDVVQIRERCEHTYRGDDKYRSSYRTDLALLRQLTRPGVALEDGVGNLRAAVRWLDSLEDVARAEDEQQRSPEQLALVTAGHTAETAAQAATTVFNDNCLSMDLDGLQRRFREEHRGLNKLRSAYRRDARALRGALQPGVPLPEGIERLPLARAWHEALSQERAARSVAEGSPATHRLVGAQAEAQAAAASARMIFTDEVLEVDVRGLADRFDQEYQGDKKLRSGYRADVRTLQEAFRGEASPEEILVRLDLVQDWQDAEAALRRAEAEHAEALGHSYEGLETDFAWVTTALDRIGRMLARTGDLTSCAPVIGHEGQAPAWLGEVVSQTRESLQTWLDSLAPEPVLAGRPELALGGLKPAVSWFSAQRESAASAAEFTSRYDQVLGRDVAVAEARDLLRVRREAQRAHERLATAGDTYRSVLEALWQAEATDQDAVRSALTWTATFRKRLTGQDQPLLPDQVQALDGAAPSPGAAKLVTAWRQARDEVRNMFSPERQASLERELHDFAEAEDLLGSLADDPGGADEWMAYVAARRSLEGYALRSAVQFCIDQALHAQRVPGTIERAVLQGWVDHVLSTDPALAVGRAADRDSLVSDFCELDTRLVRSATGEIIRACNERRPKTVMGESSIITREAEKKKRHLPIRLLIDRTRNVTQAIKPCFMMSPLAVSQYLPSDLHFDVVIFDEASQVTPGDAINCLYRGRALIAAGDPKQLPPTNFFGTTAGDGEEEWTEENDNDNADFESILDLAKGCGAFPSLTLRWHYRSRHENLIAFSNVRFYQGNLITFPGAQSVSPDLGLELFPVAGTYRRGTTRDNPVEAEAVAARVLHHYRTRPGLSLGVVTFSEQQALAVESAVERALDGQETLRAQVLTDDRLNGFFVKNLESVQGDERDVIIFSIGYGPDENGKLTMNFGPLNRAGGWRRLNVAITRARCRNEIVSSISASDISTDVQAEGVQNLRSYLDFAARGPSALTLKVVEGLDAESPFEESVIAAIRSYGYTVVPQVGTAGYRIDIGIQHPQHPGVFMLGVECDGYHYHSSRTARDRDRLRQQVLEGLGWRLHRIWSTAWARSRREEESRLREALESAMVTPITGLLVRSAPERPMQPIEVTMEAQSFSAERTWVTPYLVAGIEPLPRWLDAGEPAARDHVAAAVRHIVDVEAPVHVGLIHQRLRAAWAIGRVAVRVRNRVDQAIADDDDLIRVGDFVGWRDREVMSARTPTAEVQRPIEHIADTELAFATRNLVTEAGGIAVEELCRALCEIYGWQRRTSDITTRMDRLVRLWLEQGLLGGIAANLSIPS